MSELLAESESWCVSGLRDVETFFRNVPAMLPETTHLLLEGAPASDITALLSSYVIEVDYPAPKGTLWSWPRSQRFVLRASSELMARLSEAAARHAEPEICSHLHFYCDGRPLAQWFDAFDDPLFVAKIIPRERVEDFCRATGGRLSGDE